MFKYITSVFSLLAIILIAPLHAMSLNHSMYNYAGIVPVITDDHNQTWVYFGVEYINNKKTLALLAGGQEKKDINSLATALRELNEESLDVFDDYINIHNLTNKSLPEINYNIWLVISTKLFLYTNRTAWADEYCDKFISLYNQRRYAGKGDYQKLSRSQRENYELRKVKLEDLLSFLKDPNHFDYQLISYGGKNCLHDDPLPLRWSTRIILRNQPALQELLSHSNTNLAVTQ